MGEAALQRVYDDMADAVSRAAAAPSGSASAGRACDLTAGKLTHRLGDRIADVRGRQ
jgi:hypothetical protein